MRWCVQHNRALRELWVGRTQIGADGAKSLAQALQVVVGSDQLMQAGGAHLISSHLCAVLCCAVICVCVCAQHNHTLHALYLEWNQISAAGAEAMAHALMVRALHCFCGVMAHAQPPAERVHGWSAAEWELHVLGDALWCGVVVCGAMLCGAQHNHTLHTLWIDWNRCGADGAQALAHALKVRMRGGGREGVRRPPTLQCAALSAESALCCAVLCCVVRWVVLCCAQQNKTLQTLHFEGNQIGAAGAQALADALKAGAECRERWERGKRAVQWCIEFSGVVCDVF
jgi:hypothetical protein